MEVEDAIRIELQEAVALRRERLDQLLMEVGVSDPELEMELRARINNLLKAMENIMTSS